MSRRRNKNPVVKEPLSAKIGRDGPEQYRPLLHVRDAARAVVLALAQTQTGIYNLHRENCTISVLADEVAKRFPGLEITRTPQHFEDNRNYRVSSSKAQCEIDFSTCRSITEGIEEVRDLLNSGRLTLPDHPRYWNDRYLAAAGGK